MRCIVGRQRGLVQWVKGGFGLGFDRLIPDEPRYSVTGNEVSGEHFLRIENATIDDDAEYQYQVLSRGMQKPIWANAHLTVLIPPASVEIQGHKHGARIQTREKEKIVLECLVCNAKPAA